jgi:flagellar biosynthesis protein FliR
MTDWMNTLAALADQGEGLIRSGFLVFLRVGAAMALMPAFGEHSVPQRVRLVLGLAFTAIIAPTVADRLPPTDGVISPMIVTEVLAGLILGVGLRLFVNALQLAGAMAAQATSLSQIFAGAGAEPQTAIAHLWVVAGLALAVMAGLHVKLAALLILSYDLLPPGQMPGSAEISAWGLMRITQAFSLGFSLAAPFVIASLIYNVALGVINRAMPQLMVAFVGAPALTFGGLVLLMIVSPLALVIWIEALNGFLLDPLGGG